MNKVTIVKKIILSIAILLCVTIPANALPNQSVSEFKDWIKNHKFLSTWLQHIVGLGTGGYFLSYRELKDHWFIDLFAYSHENKIDFEVLYLLKKIPVKKSQQDHYMGGNPNISLDKRKWTNIECKNIWTRESKTATSILNQLYGNIVADDFNNSTLVYTGPVIYNTHLTSPPADDFIQKIDVDDEGKPIEVNSISKATEHDVVIYLGKLYAYSNYTNETEIRDYNYGDETEIGNDNVKLKGALGCGLRILDHKYGKNMADIYNYNQNIYKIIINKKQNRDVPADIKID